MTGSTDVADIIIARYADASDTAAVWRVQRSEVGWRVMAPDGSHGDPYPEPVDAIVASGACRFEPGIGLHIRTSGLVDHFDLLPALQSWTEEDQGLVDESDWWGHEVLGWTYEAISDRCSSDRFELEPNRVIRIDDAVCAVHRADRHRSARTRYLVIFEETNPLWPAFFQEWATAYTDNGYGTGTYAIGEITPGFEGEVFWVDEIGHLRVEPLPEGHQAPSADEMVNWISGNVEMTAGFADYELEIDGDTVTAVFPDEGPGGQASGSLGPIVVRARGSGVDGADSASG